MIVPMKKVTLLTLTAEENTALTELRKLGVMQVELQNQTASANTAQRQLESEAGRRAMLALQKIAESHPQEASSVSTLERKARSGAQTIDETLSALDRRDRISGDLDSVRQRRKELAVWGIFQLNMLDKLRASGVYVTLCAGSRRDFEELQSRENIQCTVVDSSPSKVYFVVVSLTAPEAGTLPEFRLNSTDDPQTLQKKEEELELDLQMVQKQLLDLSRLLPAVRRRAALLDGELEYAKVFDSLADHGAVSSITGFVPAPGIDKLTEAAKRCGWGLLIEDPSEKDRVPTLIQTPGWVKVVNPLFQFLGIAPGYDELDVSAGVLVFFTIFYAMIVGDAGYGVLFLAGALFAAWKFRGKPAAKQPIRLFILLSAATIVWGALSGNWFGTSLFPGIKGLTDTAVKDANTQAFCFLLAIAQLSLGRIWRAVHDNNWRSYGRNIGWMLILWGNFFLTLKLIVWPGDFPVFMYYLYGIGLAGVVVCDVNWKNPADIFQFPFSIIGSFVDVLSYIRLFAVGMAGFYIASSFNGMGKQIYELSPWFVLGSVLVILFGHLLNIALCVMSVLVHGVRLNTLEFSNHVGLRWGGSNFKPFKNIKKSEEN